MSSSSAGQARRQPEVAGRRRAPLVGQALKITATTQEGITQENAKKISKLIRDEGPRE